MKAYQSEALKAILGDAVARSELRSLIQSGASGVLRAVDQDSVVVGADPRRTSIEVVAGKPTSPTFLGVEGHISVTPGGTARGVNRNVPEVPVKRFHIRVTPVK